MASMIFISLALLCSSALAERYLIYDNFGRAALEIHYQTSGRQVYRDEGTGAFNYLGVWEPNPYQNFYMIGMKAQNDWNQIRGSIEMIRGVTPQFEQAYLRPPTDFVQVWRDQGGFGQRDAAMWRPICPVGFVSLGDVMKACDFCGWPKPSELYSQFRCVSQQLTYSCSHPNQPLWNNDGGFEIQRGSVWQIIQSRSAFWRGNQGYFDRPTQNPLCLRDPDVETTPRFTQSTQRSTWPWFTTRTTPRLVTFKDE